MFDEGDSFDGAPELEASFHSDNGQPGDGRCPSALSTIAEEASFKSDEFIPAGSEAAQKIFQDAEISCGKREMFIQDDPRFEKSRFEKENSWEPSVYKGSPASTTKKENAQKVCSPSVSVNDSHFVSTPNVLPEGGIRMMRRSLREKFSDLSAVEADSLSVSGIVRAVAASASASGLLRALEDARQRPTRRAVDLERRELDADNRRGPPPLPKFSSSPQKLPPLKLDTELICQRQPEKKTKEKTLERSDDKENEEPSNNIHRKNDVNQSLHSNRSSCSSVRTTGTRTSTRTNSPVTVRCGSASSVRSGSASTTTRSIGSEMLRGMTSSLNFGFVSIEDSSTRKFTATNCSGGTLKCRYWLRSNRDSTFQVLNGTECVLSPGEELSVHIRFSPTQLARYNNALRIETSGHGEMHRYTVTLLGVGGVSNVMLEQHPGVYASRMGSFVLHSLSSTNFVFTLRNTGVRSAFVRVIVCNETGSRLPAMVHPTESLVLRKNDTAKYSVRLSSASASASAHVIRVYWGEETQRQRCLHFLRRSEGGSLIVQGEDFSSMFLDEETFTPPTERLPGKTDLRLFSSSLRSIVLYIRSERIDESDVEDGTLVPDDTFQNTTLSRTVIPDITTA